MSGRGRWVVGLVAVAIPLLVSQLLPSENPDRWSPTALALLAVAGGLAGWLAPTVRGWIATAAWVVVGTGLILLSWTDLVLDVPPSILPVETWRTEVMIAILTAVAIVSAGFVVGATIRRRGRFPGVRRPAVATLAAAAVATLVGAGLVATAFAGTGLVLQPDDPVITVLVTEDGVHVRPEILGDGEFRLVYESRAGRPVLIASVLPLSAGDGTPRAMTAGEIEAWLSGEWASLEPSFHTAVRWRSLDPGTRAYGGPLTVIGSTDGSGGLLWYVARSESLRPWPAGAYDGEGPEPAPWPIDAHAVVPVGR